MTSVHTFPRGPAEAFYEAAGDELNDFAGLRYTRARAAAAIGDTTISLESTYGWPAAGKVVFDGVVYSYSGKTASSVTGLSPALRTTMRLGDPVVDWSRTHSSLDQARSSIFVGTAEGEDLDILGRNFGFPRYPGLSDSAYRDLIQALAWGPKGTVASIHTALTALVGAGNFEVVEDLISHPCEVFVVLKGAAVANTAANKTFAQRVVTQAAVGTNTVLLPDSVAVGVNSVNAVYLAPSTHTASFNNIRPSAEAAPWSYTGTTAEATEVLIGAGPSAGTCFINDASGVNVGGQYTRNLQIEDISDFDMTFTMARVTSSARVSLGVRVDDGVRSYGVAWDGTTVCLFDHTTNLIVGSAVNVDTALHTYRLVRRGNVYATTAPTIELWLDGVLILTQLGSAFSASATRTVKFGAFSTTGTMTSTWADFTMNISSYKRNHWNWKEPTGASFSALNPSRIVAGGLNFAPGDVGKVVVVRNSVASNGRNNGRWQIFAESTTFCLVEGIVHAGAEIVASNRIRLPEKHYDAINSTDVGTRAALTTGTGGAGLRWTALYGGVDGNSLGVALVNAGANKPLSVSIAFGVTVTVQLETDGSSVVQSTAAQVKAAVEANPQAMALLNSVETLDGVGAGVMVAVASTPLAGGVDGKYIYFDGGTSTGTHKIAGIIDDRTILVGSHAFVPAMTPGDTGTWRRIPNFDTEAGAEKDIIAAGTAVANLLTLRTGAVFYAAGLTVEVHYDNVDNGTILLDEFTAKGAAKPFYLYDQVTQIRDILDTLTVAGVHVRIDEEL